MNIDYTYYKEIQNNFHILKDQDKKNIINFYKESNNIIKKILVTDKISTNLQAKIGDIICYVDKHLKKYRLVVSS